MTFVEIVRKTHFYFKDSKLPTDDTMDIWIEEAGKYPPEFYDWCFAHFKSTGKKCLENFPKSVRETWGAWLQANPKKIERREFVCKQPACKEGRLFVYGKDGYSYVFRCGECAALSGTIIPMATLEKLLKDGYVLQTPEESKKRTVQYDSAKWKRHYGGKGVSGEGYMRLQELAEKMTDDLPF